MVVFYVLYASISVPYQEQESIFQGSDRSVTMRDLSEMKYLERVIKETLRLYPSVPGVGRILSEDIKMGNTCSMQYLLCQYSDTE
jgi:cytochrome P450